MSIVLQGSTSGSITLQEPAVAGSTTINLPATTGTALVAPTALTVPNTTGTVMVSGNMPAFSAYQTAQQTLSSATITKITFDTEEYDTANCFASSRFTPNVAGYYQFNAKTQGNASYTAGISAIYKNGSLYRYGYYNVNATGVSHPAMSCLVYCNGSTDYVEFYASFQTGQDTAAVNNSGTAGLTWFQGYLVRAA